MNAMSKTQRPLTVLVLDGERLLRWAIAEVLRGGGHEVIEAATAREVGRVSVPVDVVLLDYHLPDSSDLRLLQDLRRHLPHSALVLMTAHVTPLLVEQAFDRGVFRVVAKPFDMDDLEELVIEAWRARGVS